jgi:hypothetical protein
MGPALLHPFMALLTRAGASSERLEQCRELWERKERTYQAIRQQLTHDWLFEIGRLLYR